MGFLDRIFKKGVKQEEDSPDDPAGATDYDLEMLESRIRELAARADKGPDDSASETIDSVRSSIERIRKITLAVGKTPCHGGVHERFRKIITTSKPVFVKGVLDSAASLENVEGCAREDHARALEAFLADLSRMLTGPGRYFPVAYPEEVNELKKESNVLVDCLKELKAGVEVDGFGELKKSIASLKEKTDLLDSLRAEAARLEKILVDQKKELGSLEGELEALDGGSESQELKGLETRAREVRKQIAGLENQVYNLLTPMKRPFKKFRKELLDKKATGISTDLLASYVKDPLQVYYSTEPEVLTELFRAVMDEVGGGGLELSGGEKEKTMSRIENIIDSDLQGIKSGLMALKAEEKDILSRIEGSSLPGKRREICSEIDRSKRDLENTASETESLKKKEARVLQEIDDERKGVEEEFFRVEKRRINLSV